jgi:hypothetical protein
MKKLKLHLDDLRIDSFATTATEKKQGTVFGEQCTCWTQCAQNTCPGCPTCDGTCQASCDVTCEASCGFTPAGRTCQGYTCDNNGYWIGGQLVYC